MSMFYKIGQTEKTVPSFISEWWDGERCIGWLLWKTNQIKQLLITLTSMSVFVKTV